MLEKILRLAALALVASAGSLSAQPANQAPPPGCKTWNADLPAGWTPWADTASSVTAARDEAELVKTTIDAGKKFAVTLAPAKSVHMRVETPDIDPPPDSHNGMLSVRIPEDGYYWVAVSQGLWIDIVSGGAILDSTDHGPGPHCASIAKSVQFKLKAGVVTLQFSDNRGAHLDVLVARQP